MRDVDKNFNSIDFFKIIMAVLVISLHTKPMMGCSSELKNIYLVFANSAVPFFFMATGYLTGKKSSDILPNIKKNIAKYIKLYIVWNCVYLPLTVYGYVTTNSTIPHALLDFMKGLFITGEHYNSWMLWYLLSAIYAFIYIYISKSFNTEKMLHQFSMFISIDFNRTASIKF